MEISTKALADLEVVLDKIDGEFDEHGDVVQDRIEVVAEILESISERLEIEPYNIVHALVVLFENNPTIEIEKYASQTLQGIALMLESVATQ